MKRHLSAILVLGVFVVISGIMVVMSQHDSRKQFRELQALEKERQELEIEWGRLELEQGSWTTHSRIESLADKRLGMKIPQMGDTVMVQR